MLQPTQCCALSTDSLTSDRTTSVSLPLWRVPLPFPTSRQFPECARASPYWVAALGVEAEAAMAVATATARGRGPATAMGREQEGTAAVQAAVATEQVNVLGPTAGPVRLLETQSTLRRGVFLRSPTLISSYPGR